MKRFTIRLTVLVAVVLGGAIAIAQAQRMLHTPLDAEGQPADAAIMDDQDASPDASSSKLLSRVANQRENTLRSGNTQRGENPVRERQISPPAENAWSTPLADAAQQEQEDVARIDTTDVDQAPADGADPFVGQVEPKSIMVGLEPEGAFAGGPDIPRTLNDEAIQDAAAIVDSPASALISVNRVAPDENEVPTAQLDDEANADVEEVAQDVAQNETSENTDEDLLAAAAPPRRTSPRDQTVQRDPNVRQTRHEEPARNESADDLSDPYAQQMPAPSEFAPQAAPTQDGPSLAEPGILRPEPQAIEPLAPSNRAPASQRPTLAVRRMRSENGPAVADAAGQRSDAIVGTGRPGEAKLDGQQMPSLSIRKIAPKEVQVGAPAVFQLVVRNTGECLAEGVEVRDEVPQGTNLIRTVPYADVGAAGELVWHLGDLRPGEEAQLQIELVPTVEGEIGSQAIVTSSARAGFRAVATRPELVVDVTAPRQVLNGTEVKLSIKITNTGTGVAHNVVLEDELPEGLLHPQGSSLEYEVGELGPGKTHSLELPLKAVKAGALVNQLVARGDGDLAAVAEMQVEIVAPALSVNLSGPKRRFLERQATYTVAVANPGTASARDVELVTHLPRGMKFVEADNHGEYDPRTRTVRWSLDELPARQRGQVTLVAVPIEAGEQMLRIEGKARSGLTAEFEQPVLVEGASAVVFEVINDDDQIDVGSETTYVVRVANEGTKAAGQVEIVVIVPDEMKALEAEGPSRHLIDGQRVIFDALPQLDPKAEQTYKVRVKSVQAGDLRVRVQLLTDEMEIPVTKEERTQVYGDE